MHHDNHQSTNLPITHPGLRDYLPLLVVIGTIIIATAAVCVPLGISAGNLFGYSMGFFFLIFGMFKMMDLGMFAMGYREYDIVAKRVPAWGYLYPFIELGLGAAYLARIDDAWLHIVTLILSVLIIIGVGLKLARRETIHCVCLGNILKVPLTYVSLIEYAAMGAMAGVMLVV